MLASQITSHRGTLLLLGFAITLMLIGISITILIRRRIRSQIREKGKLYRKLVEELLFQLLSDKLTMEESLKQFQAIKQSNLLSKVTTRSVISLHQNYVGSQREKLEDFFVLSDLTAYSFRKIQSQKAKDIIAGIRHLSIMNVHEAFELIKLELEHPDEQVKKEAFIGLVTLQGMEGLSYFDLPAFTVDDLTQDRILAQMKNNRFTSFAGVHLLLYSSNESLLVLGARIVELFQLHPYYDYVLTFDQELQFKYQKYLEEIRKRIQKRMVQ